MFSFRGCNLNKHVNFKDRFIANEKEEIKKKKRRTGSRKAALKLELTRPLSLPRRDTLSTFTLSLLHSLIVYLAT